MASITQICNMALSHIGSESAVASISPPDGSAEAAHCARFYDLARTELLEPGQWNFSLKRFALAEVDNDSSTWAYAYRKPSDCLRALRIPTVPVGITVFTQDSVELRSNDRQSAEFDIEGQVIYTNAPDAELIYVADVTDSTKFTPTFTAALSFNLASYLAGPIIKGSEGARLSDAMRQRAMTAAEMASTVNANASSAEDSAAQPSIVAARA